MPLKQPNNLNTNKLMSDFLELISKCTSFLVVGKTRIQKQNFRILRHNRRNSDERNGNQRK